MFLEKWSIEESWILCKIDGVQCSMNCPQFKRGTTNVTHYLITTLLTRCSFTRSIRL
jgi:hypothetical protein